MPLSREDIVTRAAAELGADPISDLAEDTNEARAFGLIYEPVLEEQLSLYNWPFARKTKELARLLDFPVDPNWAYGFQLEPDCLVPRGAIDQGGCPIAFVIEGDVLYANSERVLLKYTVRPVEDDMPAYFVELLVYALAFRAAEPVSGIGTVKDRVAQGYSVTLDNAKRMAARSQGAVLATAPGRLRASRLVGA